MIIPDKKYTYKEIIKMINNNEFVVKFDDNIKEYDFTTAGNFRVFFELLCKEKDFKINYHRTYTFLENTDEDVDVGILHSDKTGACLVDVSLPYVAFETYNDEHLDWYETVEDFKENEYLQLGCYLSTLEIINDKPMHQRIFNAFIEGEVKHKNLKQELLRRLDLVTIYTHYDTDKIKAIKEAEKYIIKLDGNTNNISTAVKQELKEEILNGDLASRAVITTYDIYRDYQRRYLINAFNSYKSLASAAEWEIVKLSNMKEKELEEY